MKRGRLLRRAVQAAGLPEDIVLGMPRVVLRGDSLLFLENHKGVVEYSPNRLRIKTSLGIVIVDGEELVLSALGENDLMVTGLIRDIVFHEGGAHGKPRMV